MRRLALGCVAVFVVLTTTPVRASPGCESITTLSCPGVTANKATGEFHGLIMVDGQPSVLETAAKSGTKAGCGDCNWELILACLSNLADQADYGAGCTGAATAPQCAKGKLLFRLFLTTDAVRNALVDTLCLGGTNDVVPVGDIAAADVQRYLKNVRPPALALHVQPANGVPAGLPAYFWVRSPASLTPVPFGGGQVRETITISPQQYRWVWGDGDASGWTADAGAPYPAGTLTHRYAHAGRYDGSVTARWGGTYTITVAGETFGPYAAVGTVTRTQQFATSVLRAHSTLVSHG